MPAKHQRDESGAALILALVFLVLGSLTVYSLTGLAGTNLQTTSSLQGERSIEYTADGGVEAAIQWYRYQAPPEGSPCSYSPTSGLDQDNIAYYSYVSCSVVSPLTNSRATSGSSTLQSPPGGSFVPQDVGQQVASLTQGAIPPGTIVSGYVDGSHVTMSSAANVTTSNVQMGTPGQVIVTFNGCAAQFVPTSCTTVQAVVTATVLFFDTDQSGQPSEGRGATVLSWLVNRANG